uniref:Glycosyltransferase n=1 Tax=viral metagenome TaxID=1070528 RepID=A0A6C0B066_9ZZZZ|tara:strand:+ start:2382 stop:3140 length:759 start_codon:yes stop_codon:yes gene_type:complete
MDRPIYIYIHVCCINNWKTIFKNLYDNIKIYKIYDKVTEIRIGILGDDEEFFNQLNDNKIKILGYSKNKPGVFERFTLNKMYQDSLKEDFYCLYMHTKGVSKRHENNIMIKEWVECMLYFNLNFHEFCIEYLKYFDAIGILLGMGGQINCDSNIDKFNLPNIINNKEIKIKQRFTKNIGFPLLHYSGNFWWSKSEHIKNSLQYIGPNYLDPEFAITKPISSNYLSLFNTKYGNYNKSLYLDKPIQLEVVSSM